MIGNLSFEEHVRHFTEMYNHLKSVNQHLDDETIINTIYSKVMIVQEWENVAYNLNIENVYDTAMVKDFEKWLNQFHLHNNGNNNNNSGDDDESSDSQNEEDDGDLLGLEYYLRNGGEGGNNEEDDDEEEEDDEEDENEDEEDDGEDENEDSEEEEDELEEDLDELRSQDDALVFSYGGFVRRETFPPEIPDDY